MIKPSSLGFLGTAERVLAEASEPLHYAEITKRGLQNGWLSSQGKTPAATMNARISASLRRQGAASPFVRVAPGVFGLRTWLEAGTIREAVDEHRSLVPLLPDYSSASALLPVWQGATASAISGMRSAIAALTGTPQQNMDWTDPDSWIQDRLEGEPRLWAQRTWDGTRKAVNPRHLTGLWFLLTNHKLLDRRPDDTLALTEAGRDFLEHSEGEVVRTIDDYEGILELLRLVSELGPARRADLLKPWQDFLQEYTKIRSDSSAKSTLYQRLRNLLERELIERVGQSYQITEKGAAYLDEAGPERTIEQQIRKLAEGQKREFREDLRALLSEIDPFDFEDLIKHLLQEMGYDEVEVTTRSGDMGVDVVGSIEMGITSVREVVQVKRHRANIQRPVLDALRGSLHRWKAVRGTIITIGNFSKGTREAAFEAGAAPITLIDGEKLLDLLVDNEIGVRKRKVELLELDTSLFSGHSDEGSEAG